MASKTEYINRLITSNKGLEYEGPSVLYKYRPFDDFTFDMLEKNYVYLCPAEKLDDKTECITTIDLEQVKNIDDYELKSKYLKIIMGYIKPFIDAKTFKEVKTIISEINIYDEKHVNQAISVFVKKQQISSSDANQVVNYLKDLPNTLEQDDFKTQYEALLLKEINARKETGICSLCEAFNNKHMWENYSRNYKGYCIEYDMNNYENNKSLLPVIYQAKKETDVVSLILKSFLGQYIKTISKGQIDSDRSQYLKPFVTKHKQWEYQKEWRLIGCAGERMDAPKIKKIYVGKNADVNNKERLKTFCYKSGVDFIELCDYVDK